MIQFSFEKFRGFDQCPEWWKNFAIFHKKLWNHTGELYFAYDRAIEKYNGKIIDQVNDPDAVDYLEFETEDDFKAFKLYWTLYGK